MEYHEWEPNFDKWTPEKERRRNEFVAYLLGFLELEDEPETPDELVIEVGEE